MTYAHSKLAVVSYLLAVDCRWHYSEILGMSGGFFLLLLYAKYFLTSSKHSKEDIVLEHGSYQPSASSDYEVHHLLLRVL